MEQKVIGIETLNAGERCNSYYPEEKAYYDQFSHKTGETHSRPKSNKLQALLLNEYELVDVEWIIE